MIDFKTYSFDGKKVLIRVDFNVPLNKETFEITDEIHPSQKEKIIDIYNKK